MSRLLIKSYSEQDTYDFAKKIAVKIKARLASGDSRRSGEVFALSGNLGAGKTQFVKGLAKALGIKNHITSPTFVLMKVYPVKLLRTGSAGFNRVNLQLIHIDAYRLSSADDLKSIGVTDYLGCKNTITAIEWPERIKKILPKNTIWIKFKYGKKENERIITIANRYK